MNKITTRQPRLATQQQQQLLVIAFSTSAALQLGDISRAQRAMAAAPSRKTRQGNKALAPPSSLQSCLPVSCRPVSLFLPIFCLYYSCFFIFLLYRKQSGVLFLL